MDARKITIVSTKNQCKKVITSAATTLQELKADLDAAGIDYSGMTFYEGLSKTELKTNDSVLPHDVPYKGTTTNELVFMLTNTNKKIKSGAMKRSEAYAAIKSMNLQSACMKKYGKNFTMCKTSDLIDLINEHGGATPTETPHSTPVGMKEPATPVTATTVMVDMKARAAIKKLAQTLYEGGYIEDTDIPDFSGTSGNKTEKAKDDDAEEAKASSPYSDDELDDMFYGMDL